MPVRPLLLALLAAAAAAQPAPRAPAPDVEGVWEMVASEGLEGDDVLVFARLAISDGQVRGLYIFLDPDDGDLASDRYTSRYLVSDGQLVVRKGAEVTVWDVARDANRLAIHDLETGVTLVLRRADDGSALDPALVGAWSGTRDGRPFAVAFRPDGTATTDDDGDRDDGPWAAAGAYVVLGDDPARYTFARDADGRRQLVVEAGGERSVLSQDGP